jgi:DNA-binding CsgD family transcriptional regulator
MPTRTQKIIAFRKKGLSRRQIATQLGISTNLAGVYIHHLLRESIITRISPQEARRRRQGASAQVDVAEARRLRHAGESYRKIGVRFGVSGPTISKLLDRLPGSRPSSTS